MSACIVCKEPTTKYKCPRCYERYCSVSCCKTHKGSCIQLVNNDSEPTQSRAACESRAIDSQAYTLYHNGCNDDDESDQVEEELLQKLGESTDLKNMLANPHLRAMMENLVNTDQPESAIAAAMKEPIFTEFADVCLEIVDSDNPNLEKEGVS